MLLNLVLSLSYCTLCFGAIAPLAKTSPWHQRSQSPQVSFNACPAASWPVGPQSGYAISPAEPNEDLQAALAEISADEIQYTIAKLVTFGTRHTLSDQNSTIRGIGAARRWLTSKMEAIAATSNGRMTVTVPCYTQEPDGDRVLFPVLLCDIVTTLHGSVTPERVYVVSGHYDSRCTDPNDYTSDAPGADDDGSGVAVMMEMARVMATRNPRSTMVFTTVAGEEQNLYGSNFLAQTYKNSSVNVAGMLNNDIVGSPVGSDNISYPHTLRMFCQGLPNPPNDTTSAALVQVGGENDSPARELGRYIVENAQNNYTGMSTISMIYRLDRYLRAGDHLSFLDAGYTAVRFTEPRENYAHQHQNVRVADGVQYGDLIEFVDFNYITRVAKVNLAAMYSLQAAPAIPTNVTLNATALSNESTFYWLPGEDEDGNVAGYEVVYRPTDAPLWTHAIPVGMVSTATVDVSKDNVVFGIRAVGTNGYKSPAVFAGTPNED